MIVRRIFPLFLLLTLFACGGGSTKSEGTSTPTQFGAINFSPNPIKFSFETGISTSFKVTATPRNLSDFANAGQIYALIIDDKGILRPQVELEAAGGGSYTVTLHTAANSTVGYHQGNLQIKLCRTVQCTSEFPGSPYSLPYEIDVKASTRTNGVDFDPITISANVENGLSASIQVKATPLDPADYIGSVAYAEVIDTKDVFSKTTSVVAIPYRYQLNLVTNPSLNSGTYQGNIQVKLCRDQGCTLQITGSPFSLPYSIVVKPIALKAVSNSTTNLSVQWGSDLTTTTQVSVTGVGLSWKVKTNASWLTTSANEGTGNTSFTIKYLTKDLPEGSYSTNIEVTSNDGQVVTIPVKLTVTPVSFRIDGNMPKFSAINGAPIPSQTISLKLQSDSISKSWTSFSDRNWLSITPKTGQTPSLITLTVDPSSEKLASGDYSAYLSFKANGVETQFVPVSLNLISPTLSASPAQVVIGGDKGRDFSPQTVTLNLNTATNKWPWTLENTVAGVTASTSSGLVDAVSTTFSLTPNANEISVGSTIKTMKVIAKVNGDIASANLNLTINRDERKINSSRTGVAFTSTPGWTRLTQMITLRDNFNLGVTWKASSDQAWLSVPASGTIGKEGSQVTLTANADSLIANTINYATITFTPDDTTIPTIKVKAAIWKGSTTPTTMVKLPLNYSKIIADTIRPYVYANSGTSSIDVYHVYSGQKIANINNLGGALGDMAVSANGDYLYVLNSAAKELITVDLLTMQKKTAWTLNYAVSQSTHLISINPNGKETIAVSDGSVYTPEGATLSKNGFHGVMSATSDGRAVYIQDEGLSPSSISGYDVDYSAISGGMFMVKNLGGNWSVNNSSNGTDIAVSQDGSRVYMASGAPYRCSRVDPRNLTFIGSLPGGDAYPNNVEVGSDGRVYCGISGWYSTYDVWMHSADGVMLKGYKFAGYAKALKPRQLVISPDGLIMIALTDDPLLVFNPIGL